MKIQIQRPSSLSHPCYHFPSLSLARGSLCSSVVVNISTQLSLSLTLLLAISVALQNTLEIHSAVLSLSDPDVSFLRDINS